ncbi:GtrA family protein [Paenibacillus alkalitolerans]|uniref:GtrA family protein n=1 Tax=Paenibacillus alkalitolerans TaxID=2799335 RepID=UPI0018F41DCA|nr:GtrA family protein [Paenibacillus alkalitolerans]
MNSKLALLLKFGVVGIMNSAIDASAFLILAAWGMPIVAAQICAYVLGTLNSYLVNGRWTFKSDQLGKAGTLLRFLTVNLITLGATSAMLVALHEHAGLPLLASKILVIGFGLFLNFTGSRFWVYRSGLSYKRSDS